MRDFIKLTDIDLDKVIILNSSLIQSIEEYKTGSIIVMGFKSTTTYYVKETPDQVLKKIDKQW